jgi:hypothetical protein
MHQCIAFGFFLHFLPLEYFRTTILDAKNEILLDPLTWDEFLAIHCYPFALCNNSGSATRQMFWSNNQPEIICGAPFRLHAYMSRRRFEAILKHHSIHNKAT